MSRAERLLIVLMTDSIVPKNCLDMLDPNLQHVIGTWFINTVVRHMIVDDEEPYRLITRDGQNVAGRVHHQANSVHGELRCFCGLGFKSHAISAKAAIDFPF
jgi:hypothetical protein